MAARSSGLTKPARSGDARPTSRHDKQATASSSSLRDSPREVTVHEAKTHLSRLLTEVEAGGTVIITRRGKRVAKLESVQDRPRRVFGSMKGMFEIDERFFEPLPDDELQAWEGG